MTVITSGLMTDPFPLDEDDDEISPLINISTGVRKPFALAERLVRSFEIGTAQMAMFVEQRLNTNKPKFWDSLPKDQDINFVSMVKKKTVKLVDEKVLNINAEVKYLADS